MQESRTFTMRYSNHIVDETTHAFKCAKWFALVSSLLLGIFGTVLLIWPNTSMNVICTLLGVLMVVFGVSKIVGYFFNCQLPHLASSSILHSDFSPCCLVFCF